MKRLTKDLKDLVKANKKSKRKFRMDIFYTNGSSCLVGELGRSRTWFAWLRSENAISEKATYITSMIQDRGDMTFNIFTSIYQACSYDRKFFAKLSGLFTEDELNHTFLNSDNPTRKDGIDYVELIISKIENEESL